MIDAILKGKISSRLEGKEDLLTSVVFGTFKLLPIHLGISKLMRIAVGLGNETRIPVLNIKTFEIEFWPWWQGDNERYGAEPDVALWLTLHDTTRKLIAVEVKRNSGKHGVGEKDQLRRQIANGIKIAKNNNSEFLGLIYITEDFSIPTNDIQCSLKLLDIDAKEMPFICWVSWHDFIPIFSEVDESEGLYRYLVNDVSKCLQKWKYYRYNKLTIPTRLRSEAVCWQFKKESP